MEDEKFVANTKIDFRITGYRKKLIRHRAMKLGKSVSKYIKDLIKMDLLDKDKMNE